MAVKDIQIIPVCDENLAVAGAIHSESWRASHRSFCTPEFVAAHTPEVQTAYLRREMAAGKDVYLLIDGEAAGIVSVWGNVIENLYVLPELQGRGYGTALLEFAAGKCAGVPTLWVLSNNENALYLYRKRGFRQTGGRKALKGGLCELEMHRPD